MTNGKNDKGIMGAIFNIQQQAEYLKKDSRGQVGSGKFGYTNITGMWDSIKQLLKDNEVVVYGSPTSENNKGNSGLFFKNQLYHLPSNESVTEFTVMVLNRQDPQALGAAITYYRRYMTIAQLGLIPDDDNDAREHRLATLEQKKKVVGAIKITFGEESNDWKPEQINSTIENIIGKHPSKIRESEADNVIELIKSYKDK